MKRASAKNGEDWLSFDVVEKDDDGSEKEVSWMVHLNFIMSNWTCIYADGCPGIFASNDSRYHDDAGCCRLGFWFTDVDDYERVKKQVSLLTDEDWDADKKQEAEKNGWSIVYKRDDESGDLNGKSRVVDKACIFANRNDGSVGSTGKVGCAFVHMGARLGMESHVDIMPDVCSQLPLKYQFNEALNAHMVYPWDIDQWGPESDEDETHNSFACWWCVDSPEAYVGKDPVYVHMEGELRKLMDDGPYDRMVELIHERFGFPEEQRNAPIPPMPGSVRNEGRPLLPLLVGEREPYRTPSRTNTPAVLAKMREANDHPDEDNDQ